MEDFLMSKNSNHQQRMMKKLKKAFNYTLYMVNIVDRINNRRKYKKDTINSFMGFTWMGSVWLNNLDLYLLCLEESTPFEGYWMTVTEDWTSKEWTELVRQSFLWEARNV